MSSIGSGTTDPRATVPIDARAHSYDGSQLTSSPVPIASRLLLRRQHSRSSMGDDLSPMSSKPTKKKAANEDSRSQPPLSNNDSPGRGDEKSVFGGAEDSLLLDQLGFPSPRPPSGCSLLCCFYAEFDNTVGPKICFQTPRNFMDQDILVSLDSIHQTLEETFENILSPEPKNARGGSEPEPKQQEREPAATETTPKNPTTKRNNEPLSEGSLSIFDSTSEYIITGNELTGNIIALSAHNMHILTRPTIISDERYQRNSLLFCVGFVLRRTIDPAPFRPILSKLALTLQSVEIETQFLSKSGTRRQLQPLLERTLVSLNSAKGETNFILKTGVLNLKLFQSPKLPSFPVPDYAVPIMIRKDWQVQMYDWDLAINWVILHIDGVANARHISKKAEVDMEIVRACLRVLRHHRVIALTDMFFYSNRYECTDKAAALLAGREPKLLQDAVDYVVKRPPGSSPASPFLVGGSISPKQPGSPVSAAQASSPHQPARFPMKLAAEAQAQEFPWLATTRREEQRELKIAIAELYCACNRNTSFGDLWINLASDRFAAAGDKYVNRSERQAAAARGGGGGRGPTMRDRSGSIHDDETRAEHEGGIAAASPSRMGSYLDSLRKTVGRGASTIDWKNVFAVCDHRRFTSFGIVHGLIVRVHRLPVVLDTTNHYPDDKGGTTSTTEQIGSMRPAVVDNEGRPCSRYVTQRSESQDSEQHRLARAVASMMDGTRCDDEIVCNFPQFPIDELVELVERLEGKKIVSIYSVTSELE